MQRVLDVEDTFYVMILSETWITSLVFPWASPVKENFTKKKWVNENETIVNGIRLTVYL